MLRNTRGILILIAAICAVLFLVPIVAAQEPAKAEKAQPAKTSLDRISGTISMLDKDHSTIDVRKDNVVRKVSYTPETKITTMNKPEGSIADLKEGTRVICVGKFDKQTTTLNAARIDIRK